MENLKTKGKTQALSPIILRIGLGAVVIWFGLQQLNSSASWIVYLPLWAENLPISQINFVYINGFFELIFGLLLVLGFYTRVVAFFLALHLFSIVFVVGYNEIGVRDFGLAVGLLSIFLHGPSDWSADEFFKRHKEI